VTVRLGLLSTANINRVVLDARSDDAPFEVVAVGSRDRGRAEAYAREHGIERAWGSYDELLGDPDVDAAYIALPNALHHEWTMRALTAGKHVLCEKPYTRRPDDVGEAWDEATRRGLVLTEGFMWRHGAQTKRLLELLPQIGELQAIRAVFSFRMTRDVDVRLVAGIGGGSVYDIGCYCVSGLRLVAGREPDRAYAEAERRDGVDWRFTGMLRFGDLVATFHAGFTADHQQLEAIGSDGTLVVPRPFTHPRGVLVLNGEEERVEPGNPYRDELDGFCAAVRGDRKPLLGRSEMLGQAKALDALIRSAESGSAVALSGGPE
jgi:D-xylose 1-dehydrogenase (NADP+, D-xylono-1,5-lactone-forming)